MVLRDVQRAPLSRENLANRGMSPSALTGAVAGRSGCRRRTQKRHLATRGGAHARQRSCRVATGSRPYGEQFALPAARGAFRDLGRGSVVQEWAVRGWGPGELGAARRVGRGV